MRLKGRYFDRGRLWACPFEYAPRTCDDCFLIVGGFPVTIAVADEFGPQPLQQCLLLLTARPVVPPRLQRERHENTRDDDQEFSREPWIPRRQSGRVEGNRSPISPPLFSVVLVRNAP